MTLLLEEHGVFEAETSFEGWAYPGLSRWHVSEALDGDLHQMGSDTWQISLPERSSSGERWGMSLCRRYGLSTNGP